jgi:hypothetical protein
MQIGRFGVGLLLLTVLGTSIAALAFDRWLVASNDNKLYIFGLRQVCSNGGCSSIGFNTYSNPLCVGSVTGTDYERIANGAWGLLIAGVILYGLGMLTAFASAFAVQKPVLFNLSSILVALGVVAYGIGGALGYYTYDQYIFCGYDFCTWSFTLLGTGVTYCLAAGGPSFVLWCITLALSIPTALLSGYLAYLDRSKLALLQGPAKKELKPVSSTLKIPQPAANGGFTAPPGYISRPGFSMLYSSVDDMFFDMQIGHYFCLRRNLWFDPVNAKWYNTQQ